MHSTTVAAPDALADVSDAVDSLVRSVAGGIVGDLTHEQLSDMVAGVRREQARLESVLLEAVGEVDARGTYVHEAALTAGAWLRMHTLATPAAAAETVRTSRTLRSELLPQTRQALADGEISARHVAVLARAVADAPPGAAALIEPEALHVAKESDVRAVAAVMKAFAHALDPDSADEAAIRRYERAGITLSPAVNGDAVISGTADDTSAALLATAIDVAEPKVKGDTRTAARRRLDGLVTICRRFLADPASPTRGGGGHPHLIVTLDASGLGDAGHRGEPDERPRVAGSPGGTLSWVGRVAGSTARRVGCDSLTTFVTIGPDGKILEAGSSGRYFTPAQRRAIIARDGDRCCAPFCDRPITWSDAHHVIPVESNGPTTVENGALLCEGHHVLLHEGHWRLHRLADGRYQMSHRTGRAIGPEPHPPGHSRPPPGRPPPTQASRA